MATLNNVLCEAHDLDLKICSLLHLSTYNDYDDLSGLSINYTDSDQVFQQKELRKIMENLCEVHEQIEYLLCPIQETSQIQKNKYGKYETQHGYYYNCGSLIEVLITDEYHDVPYWVRTRVEHNGEHYYLAYDSKIPLEGLTVRVRSKLNN